MKIKDLIRKAELTQLIYADKALVEAMKHLKAVCKNHNYPLHPMLRAGINVQCEEIINKHAAIRKEIKKMKFRIIKDDGESNG